MMMMSMPSYPHLSFVILLLLWMSSSSRNDKKNHHHDHQNKARSPSPSPFSPSFSYSFSLCLSVSVFALQSLTSASSFLHSGAVSFSVTFNTLNFEKLLLDFKISLEKLLKKERARLRERERWRRFRRWFHPPPLRRPRRSFVVLRLRLQSGPYFREEVIIVKQF